MTKIVTLILNYNGQKDTLNCLKSLQSLNIPRSVSHEVVVVDNNSADESVQLIKSKFPQAKIIENSQNSGFTGGNNLGTKYACHQKATWIMLLNNDVLVDPDLLVNLYKSTQKHPRGLIFSPKIYFAANREFHHDRYTPSQRGHVIWYAGGQIDWKNLIISHRGVDEVDQSQYDQEIPISVATGCAMLVHKDLWQNCRLFDDRFYLYYEDTDLCLRASKIGELWYVPSAFLWHLNSGSSGAGSSLHDYFLTRNRLLLGEKYASLRTKVALIKESIKLYFSGRPYQKQGVKDYYLRRFGRGTYV